MNATFFFHIRRSGQALRLPGLIALVALWLAGCALLPAAGGQPAPDLVVMVPPGSAAQALQAAALAYPGGRVQVEVASAQAYGDRAATALLAGLERPDLLLLPADSLAHWAGYHALRPLADPAEASLAPWLGALTVEGKLYGLPAQPEIEVIWYRADLFEAAGIAAPRTWEAYRAAALALNHPPGLYGAALAGSEMEAGSELAALLAGAGVTMVSADGAVGLDSAAAAAALDLYAGLLLRDGAAAPDSAQAGRDSVLLRLAQGQAALGIAPLSAGQRLQDCGASPKVCQGNRPLLAWAWLPGLEENEATGALSAWVIPLRAAHPGAAADFARWLCGAQGSRIWAQNGGTPLDRGALRELGARGLALAGIETFQPAFPPLSVDNELWPALHLAAHAAAAGEQPAGQALAQAAAAARQSLSRAGYAPQIGAQP